MKTSLLVCLAPLLLTASALGQHQHFEDFKWREKESDHFTLRASSTSHDPARRYAEKVWEVCLEILPGLEDDFTKNEFRTPGGAKGADEAPYRFTVYLVGTGHEYDKVLEQQQKRSNWGNNQLRSCRHTRNYSDPQNRYVVLCKADPENSGGGGERDMTPVFVHSTGSTILSGRARSATLPFWFTAGWGYYVEHRLFELCRVYYVDFEAYYKNNDNAEIVRGGSLGPDKPWPDAISRLCKKDIRIKLEGVMRAEILTLTPNQTGYIFALTCFLVSTDERIAKYRELVAAARDGKEVDKALLLKTYGYDDDEAFEKDWYDFLESSKFK